MTAKLIADIGGTNARFALTDGANVHDARVYACADFPDVESAARRYLSDTGGKPVDAAFAVAAPLLGDEIRMTNHAWKFSAKAVRSALGLERLIVLNDFTALALSLRHLPDSEIQKIGGGVAAPDSPIALLGPGTGLGVSGLIPAGGEWMPLQGEGGHVTLPAVDEREAKALAVLRARFGHVSAERVLSGPGLSCLYEAISAIEGQQAVARSPAEITDNGLSGADTTARATLDMFCAMLGTVASNLVLTLGAVGGVYIGGGIVPRLKGFFEHSAFRKRFEDKGRYEKYLAPIPAFVIHSELPAMVGLARAFTDSSPRVIG